MLTFLRQLGLGLGRRRVLASVAIAAWMAALGLVAQKARAFAERIAELGCGFALDDFGAGFGSFYYLKHLPFDVLKIDGEFVRNLTDSVKDQAVIKSLARIATEGFGIGVPQPLSAWLGHTVPV